MSLSGAVILLLVPPVNLVVIAAIGWGYRRHRVGRIATGMCMALLLLLALPVVSMPLLAGLERGLPRSGVAGADTPKAGAIVVLGAEISAGQGQDGAPSSLPGPLTLMRLRAAAALARATRLPVLVSGGIVDAGQPPVAIVMADSLRRDFGVPVRWIEPRSADTWQNAHDSAAMLRAEGIRTVLLVTDAWHLRRALIAFADAGLTAIPFSGQWDVTGPPSLGAIVPHASSWLRSYYALHEWIGCLWYTLRAGLAHHR